MSLERAAWLATVFACALTALILVLSGYVGYGLVAIALAVAAGINLTGRSD